MDVNVKEFLDIAVLVATGISAIFGVTAYKKQKEFDNAQKALEEFYIPVMKVLEKHFYNNVKFNADSFREAKKQVKELFDSKYMYTSFMLQDSWNDFILANKDDKTKYFEFCDCFLKEYRYYTRICDIKPLSVAYRNKYNIYRNKKNRYLSNIVVVLKALYVCFVVISVWVILLYLIIGLANTNFVV